MTTAEAPPARSGRKLPAAVLVLVVVALGGLLAQVAAAPPAAPASDPLPLPTEVPKGQGPGDPPAALDEGIYDDGRLLYLASCAGCHGQALEGSPRGPSLRGVGAASAYYQLSTGRMPIEDEQASPSRSDPAFDASDIAALVEYIGAFGGPDIPDLDEGDIGEGLTIYLQNCAGCHSASGTGYVQVGGRPAPSVLVADPLQVASAVRVGPNLMPAYPGGVLDDEELDHLVAYVMELQRLDGRGGVDLGRIGPVAETIVGFGGLALLLVVIRAIGKRAP